MKRKGVLAFGFALVLLGHSLAAQAPAGGAAAPAAPAGPPSYRVSPLWPKPLQNFWVFGSISGVAVDSKDHVWVVHRGADTLEGNEKGLMANPPTSTVCCIAAPTVLEFDKNGTLVSSWGAPGVGYQVPQYTGGIAVDGKGNVWVAAYGLEPAPPATGRGRGAAPAAPADGAAAPAGRAGRGAAAPPAILADAHITKFSRDGMHILTIGKPGEPGNPDSTTLLNRPAAMTVDDAASEVYVADSGNHRIIVFDSNTGAFKRMWGGSGDKPTAAGAGPYDPNAPVARQFRDPNCVKIAKDGLVYVCDRSSNRVQVFQKNGTFVKEMVIAKETKGATATIGSLILNSSGSVWDVAFSSDAAQRWMFVADGHNNRVLVLNRQTLAQVGVIGGGGRQPGSFLSPGSVAVDSRGVLYTGEQHHAKRVQKFTQVVAAAPAAGK